MTKRASAKRTISRPLSPCCMAESRLRAASSLVLLYACTSCGQTWERKTGAPHLRIVG